MAYNETGITDLRNALEAKKAAVYEQARIGMPIGAIAGGQLSEVRPPLQDYGTELRMLKSGLLELRDQTNKFAEEFHKRIERLEMLVGS